MYRKTTVKVLGALSKPYDATYNKAVAFAKKNPAATPEQYMATPDGMVFKAASDASQQSFIQKVRQTIIDVEQSHEPFRFTNVTASRMENPDRMIPLHTLRDIIAAPLMVAKDPKGTTNALMYYSQMWKNGKLCNVEVLYDESTNQILHFVYKRDALGPLKQIR